MGTIHGVLYRGDAKTKYWKPNAPTIDNYISVQPSDLSLINQMPNEKEAGQVMLHMIDFDPDRRQVLPTVPTPSELQRFVIPAERHAAYEMLWRVAAFGGILANTAIWLYF